MSTLKVLYAKFAGLCVISDCPYPGQLQDGTPLLEVARICSPDSAGPRSDSRLSWREANDPDNLLLVCPAHHRVFDELPSEYTVDKLKLIRDWHVERVARVLTAASATTAHVERPATTTRIQKALQIWDRERGNDSEEFWQELFTHRPELLALVTQGRPFILNAKCYVGGKAIDNHGGNIIDFVAQCNSDAVLIEIKAPTTSLMGREYRGNVYPPSREVVGAVVQALNYRLSLLNELPTLRMHSPNLTAHHPSIIVVVGDAERQDLSEHQRRSFALYRQSLKEVVLLTYDELFMSLANLAVFMEPDE